MKRFVAIGVTAAVLCAAGVCRAITFSDLDKPKPPAQPPQPPPTQAVTPGKPTAPPKPAAGPTDTYAQRDAACHQNQKCTVDSLRLPWAKCAETAPPAKVLAGKWAMPFESGRQREFFAVSDGVIVRVEDHYADPPLRRAGDFRVANAVYQDCGGGVFAFYAHIRKGSAKVKEGDRVKRGQELGLVGNSGGNGVPHLHFIILDGDYFSIPGRFRFEQMTPRGWGRRDAAPLVEDTYIRPVTEPAKPAAKPAPPPKGPVR